jgi:Fe-S cluster assembly iron-binding protein IscA
VIGMKVTVTARERIAELEQGGRLVAALLWEVRGGGWTVGLYERQKIVADWLTEVDGLELYVDPADHSKLAGMTLDYANGRFSIFR